MHWGLPWVGGGSTKSAPKGSGSSLLHEDLLLVLLNDLLVVLFIHGYELYQLMIYMYEMMTQHLVIR